jgi:hypothetical protein
VRAWPRVWEEQHVCTGRRRQGAARRLRGAMCTLCSPERVSRTGDQRMSASWEKGDISNARQGHKILP